MMSFFVGFAFFELGALCGFFIAALMQAARAGEITIEIKEENRGAGKHHDGAGDQAGTIPAAD